MIFRTEDPFLVDFTQTHTHTHTHTLTHRQHGWRQYIVEYVESIVQWHYTEGSHNPLNPLYISFACIWNMDRRVPVLSNVYSTGAVLVEYKRIRMYIWESMHTMIFLSYLNIECVEKKFLTRSYHMKNGHKILSISITSRMFDLYCGLFTNHQQTSNEMMKKCDNISKNYKIKPFSRLGQESLTIPYNQLRKARKHPRHKKKTFAKEIMRDIGVTSWLYCGTRWRVENNK